MEGQNMEKSQMAEKPQQQIVEDKITSELQSIFLDLLTSAQELSYELATIEQKDEYTRDELRDLFHTARKVVSNVKRMHRFLERFARRRA